jgi:hypothetical protein
VIERREGLEVLVRARGDLGEAVMHLVGDPPPLLLLCREQPRDQFLELLLPLIQLLVEAGVVQGQRRPTGKLLRQCQVIRAIPSPRLGVGEQHHAKRLIVRHQRHHQTGAKAELPQGQARRAIIRQTPEPGIETIGLVHGP